MTNPDLHNFQQQLPLARAILYATLSLGLVIGAGVLGNLATIPNLPGWYAGLTKPFFNPPNWIFGPVWTLLFLTMAWAFYRVLRLPPETPGRNLAIAAFVVQIALNASWSWAFFGAHSPLKGLLVIVPFLIAVVVTMLSFLPLDRVAGLSFIPYIMWVSFATLLNAAIYALNR